MRFRADHWLVVNQAVTVISHQPVAVVDCAAGRMKNGTSQVTLAR